MKWINLTKEINNAIYEAVESGYYNEESDFMSPNFMEIREWVNLDYIDPNDPNYSGDDAIIDKYIEETLKALWPIVETFGINQEM